MANVAHQKSTFYIGECGPITVREPGQANYGELVRYTRKTHDIYIEDVARLYGKIAKGDPVTGRHIRRMEKTDGFFPKDSNRRWVLATLLRMPSELMAYLSLEVSIPEQKTPETPLFLISTKAIDTKEYYTALQNYWIEGYPRGVEYAIKDIKHRIYLLKDKALCEFSLEKPVMTRLLCGYKILLADIALEQQFYAEAKHYLTQAFDIAGARACYDLQVIALLRRMVVFRYNRDFKAALEDFERAKELEVLSNVSKKTKNKPSNVEMPQQLKHPITIASQIWGQMLTVASISEAHLAEDEYHRIAALKHLDRAKELAKPISIENFQFFATFDQERYLLDSARACIASPIKAMRSPVKAEEYLAEAKKESATKGKSVNAHRQVSNDLIQARIYCDQECYTIAATTAESALVTLNGLQSKVHLSTVAVLLADIKEHIPLGIEVMSLEAELMRAQQPYLFG